MRDRRGPVIGSVTARLSLAVQPVDRYTGRSPRGGVEVGLEGVEATPVRNPSGYHVFLDLDPGEVTVVVDGGAAFLNRRVTGVTAIDPSDPATTVDPSDPDTLPLETIELGPAPAYRFPAGATLVRGIVSDPNEVPVSGASVSVVDGEPATTTNEDGEFVLFFDPVLASDVTEVDGRSVVVVDGGPPEIAVSHSVHGDTSEVLADDGESIVAEGALTSVGVAYP